MPDLISASVILTGGYYSLQGVARYDILGYVEDLPPLLVGRWNYGCGWVLLQDRRDIGGRGEKSGQ